MPITNLHKLADFGQSVWLDYISRSMIESGKLQEMIDRGVLGMTSNPSIFNNAISNSQDYDGKIIKLKNEGKSTFEIYDELTIKDIQDAADAFLDVYNKTNKVDGYVSLEINPQIANKIDEQIEEGTRLFNKVNRPNIMIKVPSTEAGCSVIESLISKGININATLIFSLSQYEKVADAYINGIRKLSENTDDLSNIHSVASVFVSRIDTAVDNKLNDIMSLSSEKKEIINKLFGKAAVANSCMLFQKSKEIFESSDFRDLINKGANIQRVLWASTGTKNSNYSDIKYVEELIIRPTVNTLPEKTLNAFIDHGEVKESNFDFIESKQYIDQLKELGIDINAICSNLLDAGVNAFAKAFDTLFTAIEQKTQQLAKN